MFRDDFLQALQNSYQAYLENGARSNKKLIPIHGFIANEFYKEGYNVKSLGFKDGKEFKIDGYLMKKDIDISLFSQDEFKAAISFKFVTGNYSQNSNNYFENMLGECINIKASGQLFFHITVLFNETPKRNKDGKIIRYEKLSNNNLLKYIKLMDGVDGFHKPDNLFIVILDVDENNKLSYTDINNLSLATIIKRKLLNNFSIDNLKDKINLSLSIY